MRKIQVLNSILLFIFIIKIMEDRKSALKCCRKEKRHCKIVKFEQSLNSQIIDKKEETDNYQKSKTFSKIKVHNIFEFCYNSITSSRIQQKDKLCFLFQIYKGALYSKNLKKQLSIKFLAINKIELPMIDDKKKILLLGLDQTLIFAQSYKNSKNVNFKSNFLTQQDLEENVQIIARPHLQEFLYIMNEFYNIYIFSSSTQKYIKKILKRIDPLKIVKGCLSKNNCFMTKKGYIIKDLRIIANCSLSDIVIVDKSVYSFAMELDNGIPIYPFYGDQQDTELHRLGRFLRQGAQYLDIRTHIRKNLKLNDLSQIPESYMQLYLKSQH